MPQPLLFQYLIGSLIPVPDYSGISFISFWYWTDRMPDSPPFQHLKNYDEGKKWFKL
jgi:hypothetical protein